MLFYEWKYDCCWNKFFVAQHEVTLKFVLVILYHNSIDRSKLPTLSHLLYVHISKYLIDCFIYLLFNELTRAFRVGNKINNIIFIKYCNQIKISNKLNSKIEGSVYRFLKFCTLRVTTHYFIITVNTIITITNNHV